MYLSEVDKLETIDKEEFKNKYYKEMKPLVIKGLAKEWPAYHKWNWDYFKKISGNQKVGIYNNAKSNHSTPVNKADEYTTFGNYLDMVAKGPAEWRIFLFNIFLNAPELTNDFTWPEHLMTGFIKRFPALFVGGQGSITHLHFDMDMSHILHTQFIGKKRILLFPYSERFKLYRKPFEVLSEADFSNYHLNNGKPDLEKYPAIKLAKGYELILEHGETLFMPAGYFHHMEYLESGAAMSLRSFQHSIPGVLHGAWNIIGMRNIDTMLKKTAPDLWYNYKIKKLMNCAQKELSSHAR